ncbi:hypothetical protein EB796_002810 [Bugula neritina]|uniref:Uncharacterized protein n=1 Tax=Bugula neritina TaxID=10212 RepID=A0A7J7KLT5_BUGNE|nr:hypothetical protein EB796_002810 [Bugula neritina]
MHSTLLSLSYLLAIVHDNRFLSSTKLEVLSATDLRLLEIAMVGKNAVIRQTSGIKDVLEAIDTIHRMKICEFCSSNF